MSNSEEYEKYKVLTEYHKQRCKLYSDYVNSFFSKESSCLEDLPYLPVRAFKEFDLMSVESEYVYKTMLSSGTTGKQSKIFLDKETARDQSKELACSFKSFFGGSRFPMLIIDSETTARGKTARTAAVNGFSMYGRKRCFALDENMELMLEAVKEFLAEHIGETVFVFGFTFVVYQHFLLKLNELRESIDLSNAFILHGGGWKKLADLHITDSLFKQMIESTTGCRRVHNYYGMIEQTGSIYFECEYGCLHAPNNGGAIIRNLETLEVNEYGQAGLIQVFSGIQKSYPGHILLTEDVGLSRLGSDCPCQHEGDVLEIQGRLESAEIRG